MANIKKIRIKRQALNVVSLVGARPQFVKLAPLAQRFATSRYQGKINHSIIHSGQHYAADLSAVFFRQLRIPKPNLNLRVGSGLHGEMTAKMISGLEKEFVKSRPDVLLIYGDTNTTLAGAIVASKMGIEIAHIESGLRSFDMSMPEEINRRVSDHLSSLLFCPTAESVKNLRREHPSGEIIRSGDLMFETLEGLRPILSMSVGANGAPSQKVLAEYDLQEKGYALFTAHRPALVDKRETLEKALKILSALKMPVVFPVHPRTLASLKKNRLLGALKKLKHVRVVAPLSYIENLTLAANAKVVLTDSGGLQKEAVFLRTPCLTMRDVSEWTETLRYGNHLVGHSVARCKDVLRSLGQSKAKQMPWKVDGATPSEIIAERLLELR
ncbi:UDP-N-acetylglucosamine 2-epimerase (non-hydrolyzing) [bacterium AH-315-J21]|nr:UDP-N-acetylglucosamine 2-epimerase (non-hydrolyzing) [bacterium AH-315-J21]